jgi:hypothetical protein
LSSETIESAIAKIKCLPSGKISGREIIACISEAGFPTLLLTLAVILIALPIPKVPPFNLFFGLPFFLFGWQMLTGQEKPSLPEWILNSKINNKKIKKTADRIYCWLLKLEKFAKPSLPRITNYKHISRMMGVSVIIMSLSVLLPLPGTSTVPAFCIAVMCLGKIYEDGRMIAAGMMGGVAWVWILYSILGEVIEEVFEWFMDI